MFLAQHAQRLSADGQCHTKPGEASGWPSGDALWLSILEATKPGVAANDCLMGKERWLVSELKRIKRKERRSGER